MQRSEVPTGNGERILIVDDEPALLEMMEKMVSELQYSVRTVASPQAALDLLRAGEVFDLLLTDTVMPGLNGFELAQSARDLCPTLPVIYMSGYAGFQENQMGQFVAPMLIKPSPEAELAQTIKRNIIKSAEPTE